MASLLNYSHQSNSSTIKCHCTLKTKAALVGSSHCLGLLSKLLGSVSYSRSAFPFRSNANLIRLYLSPLFRCRRTNCYYYRFIALSQCVCVELMHALRLLPLRIQVVFFCLNRCFNLRKKITCND